MGMIVEQFTDAGAQAQQLQAAIALAQATKGGPQISEPTEPVYTTQEVASSQPGGRFYTPPNPNLRSSLDLGVSGGAVPMPKPTLPIRGHQPDTITDPNYAVNTSNLGHTAMQSSPQSATPFGLVGAEQALQQGMLGSLGVLQQGMPQLGSAPSASAVSPGSAPGVSMGRALSHLGGFDQGVANVEQFTDAGAQAQQLQAALTGALGPEAQAEAIANYQASPGLAYQQEQAMREAERYASATGQSLGGNVLAELQRRAIGLSQQDFNNRVAQLGSQAGMGLQAASQGAGLRGQQAQLGAQLQAQGDLANQAMAGQYGMLGAQLGTQANLANQALQGQYDIAGAQLGANLASQGANIMSNTLGRAADYRYGTGQQIANQADRTYQALSNLANQQGINLSNLVGEGGRNIANLQQATGGAFADMPTSLQTLLANLAVQQGTQQARYTGAAGTAQGEGVRGAYEATENTIGNLGEIIGDWLS